VRGWGLENLPYGAFRRGGEGPRLGVAYGEDVVDLPALARAGALPAVVDAPSLDPLLAAGPRAWAAVRERLVALFAAGTAALVPRDEVELLLPFTVGDYVDFFASLHHASNLGRLLRPDEEPLLPNWRHLPVGYHGRAGSVVVSGTPLVRPVGQRKPADGPPVLAPTARLDLELELGFVTGRGGPRIAPDAAAEHVFGCVLVNDWSARDVQAWEYRPLGPFLGKSFQTSVSPWVVPLAALEPFRVPGPPQDPEPLPYLRTRQPWGLDVALEVEVAGTVVGRTNARELYWTLAQQLAHATVNGATVRPGDLFASGTISGAARDARGSLIELSWNGAEPVALADGSTRTFLEDGDEVVLRGRAGESVDFGEVRGTVLAAAS